MKALITAVLLVLYPAVSSAGFTQPAPVQVMLEADGSGAASGDMVTARFADSEETMIGCGVRRTLSGGTTFTFGFCQARDANGVNGFCNIFDETLLAGLASMGDYSFITFAWNAAGECQHIGSSTQSFYMPDFRDQGGPGAGAPGRGRGH